MLKYFVRALFVVLYVAGLSYLYHIGLVKKYDNLFFFAFILLSIIWAFWGWKKFWHVDKKDHKD